MLCALTKYTEWLLNGDVEKLVLVVAGVSTNQVLERWVFNIVTEKSGSTRHVFC